MHLILPSYVGFKMSLLSFLVTNRWILALWLLPASLVYDVFWCLRGWIVLWLGSAPRKHKERVEYVQKQVRFGKRAVAT